MRTSLLWRSLFVSLSGSLAMIPRAASANAIAFGEVFVGGGFNFERLDFDKSPLLMGSLSIFAATGAFAGNDFSNEYIVDYTLGNLYSIEVSIASPTLIGSVSTSGNAVKGMHWDPTRQAMLVVATDASCATSTLYTLDVTDASTSEIGSTPGCIASLAIDADGHAFGVDESAQTLVSIDTSTGAATSIGPLGVDLESTIGGFDFDASSGHLYLFAHTTSAAGVYAVDTASGAASLVTACEFAFLGVAFAESPDALLASGFDNWCAPPVQR